jgi:mannose-6-phosphate isomerase
MVDSNYYWRAGELSTVEGDVSVVSNGLTKGKSVMDIINEVPSRLLGTEVYKTFGKQFHYFKYLDAREDLSIQVHPSIGKKAQFGKGKMDNVMQADADARIIVGFKGSTAAEYIQHDKTLLSLLDDIKVTEERLFLDTGTVHAIGAGLVIAESTNI